jgi:hypothetical protein
MRTNAARATRYVLIAMAAVILTASFMQPADAAIRRVLMLGDSWTHFMWADRAIRDVLIERGLSQYEEFNIAVGGTKANQWVEDLDDIKAYLLENPTIDVVFMTLGGNDMLYGDPINWWDSLELPGGEDAFFNSVAENVAKVCQAAIEVRPDIHVAVCSYDYMNCLRKTSDSVCTLTPEQALANINYVNQAMIRCEKRVLQYVNQVERVQFVNNYGLMQYTFGYPGNVPAWVDPWEGECKWNTRWDPEGVDQFRFAAGDTNRPGQLKDGYVPFEGGDSSFMKSPWEAMLYYTGQWTEYYPIATNSPIDDWIHLSKRIAAPEHPKVVSITRSTMSPINSSELYNPVGDAQVAFDVTFSEPVTGVDAGDFDVISHGGVTGASVDSVVSTKDGSVQTVLVNTGSGEGTLGLGSRDNDTITSVATGVPLWGEGVSAMSYDIGTPYNIKRGIALPVAGWPAILALLGAGVTFIRRRR